MLITAEKILSSADYDRDKTDQEIMQSVRQELAQKVVDEMFHNKLFDIEFMKREIEEFGSYTKITIKTRAYHPDA